MDELYCELDELAKLHCKFDELAKLRMSLISWISCTESDEETDTADEFEDDMSCYTSTCIVQR